MASSIITDILTRKTPLQTVDLRAAAKQSHLSLLPPPDDVSLVQYHAAFADVVGAGPQHALLLSSAETSNNPFFHAGCAYLAEPAPASAGDGVADESLYVTSNLLQTISSSQMPVILISHVRLRRDAAGHIAAVEWSKLRPPPAMPMPAGAMVYREPSSKLGVLYCAQGNLTPGTSGLFFMPLGKPPRPLVTSYFGRDFNSVYDVALGPDGVSLWFTDPCHGFEHDFRKRPQLPCHVYRFDPSTGELRVVADDLRRPTGICFSPDGRTVYLSDADALHGDGSQDAMRPATIYAFDVLSRAGSDYLANKRVFAYALRGIPMGIKCDAAGHVYAGCADGVEVWNAASTLLGVIQVPGGVTNLSFSQAGEMFLCSERRLWWVKFTPAPPSSLI